MITLKMRLFLIIDDDDNDSIEIDVVETVIINVVILMVCSAGLVVAFQSLTVCYIIYKTYFIVFLFRSALNLRFNLSLAIPVGNGLAYLWEHCCPFQV